MIITISGIIVNLFVYLLSLLTLYVNIYKLNIEFIVALYK